MTLSVFSTFGAKSFLRSLPFIHARTDRYRYIQHAHIHAHIRTHTQRNPNRKTPPVAMDTWMSLSLSASSAAFLSLRRRRRSSSSSSRCGDTTEGGRQVHARTAHVQCRQETERQARAQTHVFGVIVCNVSYTCRFLTSCMCDKV